MRVLLHELVRASIRLELVLAHSLESWVHAAHALHLLHAATVHPARALELGGRMHGGGLRNWRLLGRTLGVLLRHVMLLRERRRLGLILGPYGRGCVSLTREGVVAHGHHPG